MNGIQVVSPEARAVRRRTWPKKTQSYLTPPAFPQVPTALAGWTAGIVLGQIQRLAEMRVATPSSSAPSPSQPSSRS